MTNIYSTQLSAVLAILTQGQSLDHSFTVEDITDTDKQTATIYDVIAPFNNDAGIMGQLVEHVAAGGEHYVYEVIGGGEASLGYVWLWVNEDGSTARAYA
jgi:hypothetical protein